MINWIKRHDGHVALCKHLLNAGDNDEVRILPSALVNDDLAAQFDELKLLALGARTSNPFFHVFASPSVCYGAKNWDHYWTLFEEEFALQAQPFIEVEHTKTGAGGRMPSHRHRLYLRITPDGRCITDSHSAARIHKVARLSELSAGEQLVDGPYNKSIAEALKAEGKIAEFKLLTEDGFQDRISSSTVAPNERAEAKRRRDIAPKEVIRRAFAAWELSDTGLALDRSLQNHGLLMFEGRNGRPMVLTPGRAEKRLASLINAGSVADKGKKPRLKDLLSKIGDMPLRTRAEAISLNKILDMKEEHDPSVVGMSHRVQIAEPPETATELFIDAETNFPTPQPKAASDENVDLPTKSNAPIALSDEQVAAIETFEADLDGAAEKRVKLLIAEHHELARKTRAQARKSRQMKKLVSAGSIGEVGQAAIFKALLAGVPPLYGDQIRWVEKLPGPVTEVYLKSGGLLLSTPNLITTADESIEAMQHMVAYAVEQGWDPVEITGGSLVWQVAIKQLVREEGLKIAGEKITSSELEPACDETFPPVPRP